MDNTVACRTSLLGLVRGMYRDFRKFMRQEAALAKCETSEKISCYVRNAIILAIGGFVAYAGLIVFLAGLGQLIGHAFEDAGVPPALATFYGLGIIGLFVIVAGVLMLLKGVKALSNASLAPERTLDTIKQMRGVTATPEPEPERRQEKTKRSSKELQREVMVTERQLGAQLEELAYRTSPARLRDRIVREVRTHPSQWRLGALVSGFFWGVYFMRKLKRLRA